MAKPKRICSVAGCTKGYWSGGYCNTHYARWRRKGTLDVTWTPIGAPLAWIEAHLNYAGDDCLKWPFGTSGGYGAMVVDGSPCETHRYVCERTHGSPPTPKHEARHLCGNGQEGCVNPRHIVWGTHLENMRDKIAHGKTVRGRNKMAKLTAAQVLEIRSLSGLPRVVVGKMFGVSPHTISQIIHRSSWAWLD